MPPPHNIAWLVRMSDMADSWISDSWIIQRCWHLQSQHQEALIVLLPWDSRNITVARLWWHNHSNASTLINLRLGVDWWTSVLLPWDSRDITWLDSYICETRLVHARVRETWRVHTWDLTRSYVRHDSITRATWQIHMCKCATCICIDTWNPKTKRRWLCCCQATPAINSRPPHPCRLLSFESHSDAASLPCSRHALTVPSRPDLSHTNDARHTWMRHVTHRWVISHMDRSCHACMSHVTYKEASLPCSRHALTVPSRPDLSRRNDCCVMWILHVWQAECPSCVIRRVPFIYSHYLDDIIPFPLSRSVVHVLYAECPSYMTLSHSHYLTCVIHLDDIIPFPLSRWHYSIPII